MACYNMTFISYEYFPLKTEEINMTEQLRKGVLNFRQTLFQGIAASAPAGAAVATMTGSAAYALGALPLAALVAFAIVALNGYIIKRISSHVAGAGGYYDYIKMGFGKIPGTFSGWMYLLYQVTAMSFISLSIAVFVPALLSQIYSINIPSYSWFPLLVASAGFGYLVSFGGIKGSLRYAMIMGTLEIIVVVFIGAWLVLQHPSANTASVFTAKFASGGVSGVALGVLFMYTAFSGFGGMTPLGEETKDARKVVGNAVLVCTVVLGLFFVFAAYAFTIGWGPLNMGSYAANLVPGITLADSNIGMWAAILITIFYVNSILTDNVVFTNSVSRITLAMSRDGALPLFLSRIHETRKTPYLAGAIMVVASIAVGAVAVVTLGGFNAFIFTGTVATLSALLVHMMANVSLPAILHKKGSKIGFMNAVLPVAVSIILVFVFYGTFISISEPVVIASVLFAAWAIFGIFYSVLRAPNVKGYTREDLNALVD